jgi:hypothetical protein
LIFVLILVLIFVVPILVLIFVPILVSFGESTASDEDRDKERDEDPSDEDRDEDQDEDGAGPTLPAAACDSHDRGAVELVTAPVALDGDHHRTQDEQEFAVAIVHSAQFRRTTTWALHQ